MIGILLAEQTMEKEHFRRDMNKKRFFKPAGDCAVFKDGTSTIVSNAIDPDRVIRCRLTNGNPRVLFNEVFNRHELKMLPVSHHPVSGAYDTLVFVDIGRHYDVWSFSIDIRQDGVPNKAIVKALLSDPRSEDFGRSRMSNDTLYQWRHAEVALWSGFYIGDVVLNHYKDLLIDNPGAIDIKKIRYWDSQTQSWNDSLDHLCTQAPSEWVAI